MGGNSKTPQMNQGVYLPVLAQRGDNLEAALQYWERGFSVIPIRAAEKVAAVEWKQYQCRRPTQDEIERWFTSDDINVGIVCGHVSGDLVVFDFDGQGWQELYNEFLEEFPELSEARIVETGSGKRHLWVRVPGLPEEITKRSLVFDGAKVELIANRHLIVAPPSLHPCGKPYKFIKSDEPMLEIPWDEFGPIVAWFPSEDKAGQRTKGGAELNGPLDAERQKAAAEYYLERAIKNAEFGNRNRTGFWLACQLRDHGLTQEEAKNYMLRYAPEVPQDVHRYAEKETLASLGSAYSQAPRTPAVPKAIARGAEYEVGQHKTIERVRLDPEVAEALNRYPTTDAGNAEAFKEIFGNQFCYVPQRKKWFRWDGSRWAEDNEAAQLAMIETARLRGQAAQMLRDDNLRPKLVKWALSSEQTFRVKQALSPAQAMLKRNLTDFDRDPYLLCCPNGVVNLKTGELRPARPEDLLHQCTNVRLDPTAICPRWETFLQEIFSSDEELIGFIHRAFGYTLTGDTSEQCLFMLYGTGQNGKSTLLYVLENILGEFSTATPPSTLRSTRWETIPSDVARMYGKRLVKAIEVEENKSLKEERIKALTGEDRIAARHMYKDWFDFTATGKIWWAVNHKPKVHGTDEAIWRRIQLIPFMVEFPPARREPHLKDTLSKEFLGILAWAVKGCLKWKERGLDPPQIVQQATKEYRGESDIIEQFLEECTIRKAGLKVQASTLYEKYKQWCHDNGEKEISGTTFGKKIVEKGFERQKDGCNYYTGIGLLTEDNRSGGRQSG